jgi:hypothetical protein
LKSTIPLAFVLGFACAVPVVTIANAQGSRDPANERNLHNPADQRNLRGPVTARNVEQQDPNLDHLNDPVSARNLNDKASKPDDK